MLVSTILLEGCSTPTRLSGTVTTATYDSRPNPAYFVVLPPDSLSLTDRNISSLIETKLEGIGYLKAKPEATANVAVLFNYQIGSGVANVYSSPDFVTGGHSVSSSTSYPRKFTVTILDIEKSNSQNKPYIIWQGEIFSTGSTSNISILAPDFIEVLMENANVDVTNKSFFKVLMTP